MRQWLMETVQSRADEKGRGWLEMLPEFSKAAAANAVVTNDVLGAFAGASRRLGKQALQLNAKEAEQATALMPGVKLSDWGADEVGRACLLLSLTPLPAEDYRALVLECYDQGDSREQESWLRILPLLPEPEQFLDTAIDATRTNIIPVFEAIACENPYPERTFPEGNFNQMVLKALFIGLAINRIVGLEERSNADLSRMANDYVDEREAAGRTVPTDIWYVIAPYIGPTGLERVRTYLEHDDPAHRYWAAVGLARARQGGIAESLRNRLANEEHPRVREAIETALSTTV